MKKEYGFSVTLDTGFGEAVERVTAALQEEGFGVLADIDVAGTLAKKLGRGHRPYRILGACNPALAEQALGAEPDIGLLLPCNVVVREAEDGRIVVAFMDPEAVLGIVGNPDLAGIAGDVRERLERACAAIGGGETRRPVPCPSG